MATLRRWIRILVLCYLACGVLYRVACLIDDATRPPRFDRGWSEPFSSLVSVAFWPMELSASWTHQVGIFAPRSEDAKR
jgi:hypothetical protein